MAFPSTACLLQDKLVFPSRFDIEGMLWISLCFRYCRWYVSSKRYKNALVVGAEKLSSIMDWEDRTTCVLFGDGAGAAVVSSGGNGTKIFRF